MSTCNAPCFAAPSSYAARRELWQSEKDSAVVRLVIGAAIGDAFGFGIEMQVATRTPQSDTCRRPTAQPHTPDGSQPTNRPCHALAFTLTLTLTLALALALALADRPLDTQKRHKLR